MPTNLALGSLFSGIGGFDYGFEQAGIKTSWQVEINPVHRLVLADRFPSATRYEDVTECGTRNLAPVDIIAAGFPCQDISSMATSGEQLGLAGKKSSLFWQVIRIAREIQPTWLVLENVPNLIAINDGEDFKTVINALAECGYVGYWRVLNAQYFGVPQSRRRIFLVAGLGRFPTIEFLSDAAPMDTIPTTLGPLEIARNTMAAPLHTLTASNAASRINLGIEVLVAEENRWDSMVERERISSLHGIPKGLDVPNLYQRYAAGNAVVPAIARWIAEKIINSY
jgi:DNA (cytosine-5)-methyltransferase 1